MEFDSVFADSERNGNLLVCQSLGKQIQHFRFAIRQRTARECFFFSRE